jgi:hypothetical protein
LRYYATSWKVVGSSPDEVDFFFSVYLILPANTLRRPGHVIRRENEEIIKRLIIVKPEGKRKKGRPRMRWMDGMEKDLWNLAVVNWRANAQERDGWITFLEQAKTHERLWCQ